MTELSGDGPGTSDSFEISLDGPTLIAAEHTGSGNFTSILQPAGFDDSKAEKTNINETETTNSTETSSPNDTDESTDNLRSTTVVSAVGPYDGQTLHAVTPGSYVIHVPTADDTWTATVHDLPVYDDGVGLTLPIENEGGLNDIIGPINFGDREPTEFNFSVTGEGSHTANLIDREGVSRGYIANVMGDADESISLPVSGVGYIEIQSFSSWSIQIEVSTS